MCTLFLLLVVSMHHTGTRRREGKTNFLLIHHYSYCNFCINNISVICGISEDTERGHILQATLEAICFQVRDVLEAMANDCGMPLTLLQVDGGMTMNALLMQLQADLIGLNVLRPSMTEATALV